MFLESIGFWGADFWVALGTIGLFFATLLLVYVGRSQLISLREENTKSRTLIACERYDCDPVMHASFEKMVAYRLGKLNNIDPKELKHCLATILNYLDGIAIGIEQGLYDKSIVEDHLKSIINDHVSTYLTSPETAKPFGMDNKNYPHIIKLAQDFNTPVLKYHSRWLSKRLKT